MQKPVISRATEGIPRESVRLHYLDWLRELAVLGVFLFHAVREIR